MKLRFVKFFASRENEIEEKEKEDCHCVFYRHPAGPRSGLPPRSHLSPPAITPLPLHPVPPARSHHRPSLPSATCRESNILQLSLPSCSASPFLLHKLLKQQSVERRTGAGAQLTDPAVLPNDNTAGAQLAAPLLLHPIGWPRLLSGSNGDSSVAIGAIGKQSMKMNYPISSPSLMNK